MDSAPSVDVAAIVSAVRECDLVAGLHSGRHGTLTSTAGGESLIGVRVGRGNVVLGVIGEPGVGSVRMVEQVWAAVAVVEPRRGVCVRVEARDPAR